MQFTTTTGSHPIRRVLCISRHVVLALFTFSGTVACHRGAVGTIPRVTLEVTNRSFFDVNIFVIRSPVAPPTRLGMVTSGLSEVFRVAETDLQPGQAMVLQVRTIAGQTSWSSPSVPIRTGSVARLDVIATGNGDLSQSQFYTIVANRNERPGVSP